LKGLSRPAPAVAIVLEIVVLVGGGVSVAGGSVTRDVGGGRGVFVFVLDSKVEVPLLDRVYEYE